MGKSQRDKGARGERELAKWFNERMDHNEPDDPNRAYRGCQHSGGKDSPDVIVPDLHDFIHIECKRTARLSLYPAMAQAERDSGENQFPVVMHKADKKYWLAIMDARDWLILVLKAKAYDALKHASGSLSDDHQLGRPEPTQLPQDHPHQTTLLSDLGLE